MTQTRFSLVFGEARVKRRNAKERIAECSP